MVLTVEDIKKDPDKVLKDDKLLKELVKDGKLITKFLEEKDLVELDVKVDGETIHLINSPPPYHLLIEKDLV